MFFVVEPLISVRVLSFAIVECSFVHQWSYKSLEVLSVSVQLLTLERLCVTTVLHAAIERTTFLLITLLCVFFLTDRSTASLQSAHFCAADFLRASARVRVLCILKQCLSAEVHRRRLRAAAASRTLFLRGPKSRRSIANDHVSADCCLSSPPRTRLRYRVYVHLLFFLFIVTVLFDI